MDLYKNFVDMIGSDEEDLSISKIRQTEPRIYYLNEQEESTILHKVKNIDESDRSDKSILQFLYTNKELVHHIVFPILNFAYSVGITKSDLIKVTRNAFALINEKEIEDLMLEISIESSHVSVDLGIEKIWQNVNIRFLKIATLSLEHLDSFKELTRQYLRDLTYSDFCEYCKTEFFIALLKAGLFSKIILLVKETHELETILLNAEKKFADLRQISIVTYDIFVDYIKLGKTFFSVEDYERLLSLFYKVANNDKDFYNSNLLGLSRIELEKSISDILEQIIIEKKYKQLEIEKLLSSIFCEKLPYYSVVNEFIDEFVQFNNYIEKIQNIKIKEDLLNNDYSNRITIVDIDLMSGRQFEEFLCEYFNGQGYQCSTTKASGDQGIDLIAKKGELTIAIQAKCYSKTVGNHAIMEAVAGMKYYSANRCMVITNSTFSKSAIELAKANGVILWDRQVLTEKLNNI